MAQGPPPYKVYRSRRPLFGRRDEQDGALRPPPPRRRPNLTGKRIALYVAGAIGVWLLLSLLLFLVSAQIQSGKIDEKAESALAGAGPMPFSANTILVLGSDARTKRTAEPGSRIGGPSRSDTIMLMRAGGGASQRLSIPRDTIVNIPGHGPDKVNAAYAIGGPALTITTLRQYLGIEINHVVEVDFENFPEFVDALGGIDFTTKHCVISNINGGKRNGGFTLRLKPGTHHLDGEETLVLARTRKNDCRPNENDLDRTRRQQEILSAMKGELLSPGTFLRLPWVSWAAPQAIRSDMGGPSLMGLFASLAVTGSPTPRVLRGDPVVVNGQFALTVPDARKRRMVKRFQDG